jgi:hypothetical protein
MADGRSWPSRSPALGTLRGSAEVRRRERKSRGSSRAAHRQRKRRGTSGNWPAAIGHGDRLMLHAAAAFWRTSGNDMRHDGFVAA